MGTEPENTLRGIAAALQSHVDAIECDVRAAADGEVMLLHDAGLHRTTGDHRMLAEVTGLTARGLPVLLAGGSSSHTTVPTLAEALDAIDGRCSLIIEVKERGLGAAIAQRVREASATEWCWIWSFDPASIAECRAALPEVPASLLVAPLTPVAESLRTAVSLGCVGISLHSGLASARTIEEAHRRGLSVCTWTVNDRVRAAQLVADDIDGVCTDVPEHLEEAVRGSR